MNNKVNYIGYIEKDSPIHNLTGATKLIIIILASIAAMITYDTRLLAFIFILSIIMFIISKIQLKNISFLLKFMAVLMVINTVVIYLFSPEEGVRIYGTKTILIHFWGSYSITLEEIFYLFNVILKYYAIIPMALLFITTTHPSEFAASLNKIGVNYRIAYSVSLTLRYIPDVQRDFREISQAQQARGIDISKDEKLIRRIRNTTAIIMPLIFSSLSKIDTISNAMELRSFGKYNKRSWYNAKPFKAGDLLAMLVCVLLICLSLILNKINGGRFYNPFV